MSQCVACLNCSTASFLAKRLDLIAESALWYHAGLTLLASTRKCPWGQTVQTELKETPKESNLVSHMVVLGKKAWLQQVGSGATPRKAGGYSKLGCQRPASPSSSCVVPAPPTPHPALFFSFKNVGSATACAHPDRLLSCFDAYLEQVTKMGLAWTLLCQKGASLLLTF